MSKELLKGYKEITPTTLHVFIKSYIYNGHMLCKYNKINIIGILK